MTQKVRMLNFFTTIKIYVIETCSTLVFIIFVGVETVRAIKHILKMK
jgi:hypothetical protein